MDAPVRGGSARLTAPHRRGTPLVRASGIASGMVPGAATACDSGRRLASWSAAELLTVIRLLLPTGLQVELMTSIQPEPAAKPAPGAAVPKVLASASPLRRVGEFALGLGWAAYIPLVLFPFSWPVYLKLFFLPIATLSSFHFFRRALDPAPRILVDSFGIADRTSIFGKELRIPWQNVYTVEISKLNGNVLLHLRDLQDLKAGASLGRRVELFFRRLLGKNTIRINPTLLGIRQADLGREIQSAHLRYERAEIGLASQEAIDPPSHPDLKLVGKPPTPT